MKIALMLAVLVVSAAAFAQEAPKPLVWINPQNPEVNYLQAAVQKKHVPVQFTTEKKKAAFIADLSQTNSKGTALHGFYGIGHPGMIALSLSVSEAKTGNVVFSYTCQKRAPYYQSAAECLAKHWASQIRKGK